MRMRIVYEIMGNVDDVPSPVAVLVGDSDGCTLAHEDAFERIASVCSGPADLVRHLLSEAYPEAQDGHQAGSPMFDIVAAPYEEGAYEGVIRAYYVGTTARIERAEFDGMPLTDNVPMAISNTLH